MLVQRSDSGDIHASRNATWEMSVDFTALNAAASISRCQLDISDAALEIETSGLNEQQKKEDDMPLEWNEEARKVFFSNDVFKESYCRSGRFCTMGSFSNDEYHITIRREIARRLSDMLPESFHRTPGHNKNQESTETPKWLIVGRLRSRDGKIDGETRLEVLWLDKKYFLGLKLTKVMDKGEVTWKSLKCCQNAEAPDTPFREPDEIIESNWAIWNFPHDFFSDKGEDSQVEDGLIFFKSLLGLVEKSHRRRIDIVQNFLNDRGHADSRLLFPAAEPPLH